MMFVISFTVGITFGAATWGLLRGRGGGAGFVLCLIFGMIGAFIGTVAAQAIARSNSTAALGIGAVVGALLATLVETFGFRSRRSPVAAVDPAAVAATPPADATEASSDRALPIGSMAPRRG